MQDTPRIRILATGGTIAGKAATEFDRSYSSGQVPIENLLTVARDLPVSATLTAEQIANVGSQDMSFAIWRQLVERVTTVFAEDAADAVIIVHGTDTIDETGFLLDLVLPPGRPVILTCAMRPSNALSADGPRNLACALQAAVAPESRDRGVLVVSGDRIFAARNVYKSATGGTDAFRSFPSGPVGSVSPDAVRFHTPVVARAWRGRFSLPSADTLREIGILHTHAAMSPAEVDYMTAAPFDGFVVAGLGHGNMPKAMLDLLAARAREGRPVVRASRIDEGVATHNLEVDDDALGFIAGGYLSPQKCRVLLQVLLASGDKPDLAAMRACFDWF